PAVAAARRRLMPNARDGRCAAHGWVARVRGTSMRRGTRSCGLPEPAPAANVFLTPAMRRSLWTRRQGGPVRKRNDMPVMDAMPRASPIPGERDEEFPQAAGLTDRPGRRPRHPVGLRPG